MMRNEEGDEEEKEEEKDDNEEEEEEKTKKSNFPILSTSNTTALRQIMVASYRCNSDVD